MLQRPRRTQSTATPRQRLQLIARALPEDIGAIREAALRGLSEQELIEEGRRCRPEEIVDDAAELYTEAWTYFLRAGLSASSHVRGCSRQLIVLAARQALDLADLIERRKTEAQTRTKKREAARTTLRTAFERAVKLRDQARSVLTRIVGNEVSTRKEVDRAAMAEEESLPVALFNLAQIGRRLIGQMEASAAQLSMYGLDEEYLTELEGAGEKLLQAEQGFEKASSGDGTPQRAVQLCAGVNVKLMLQMLDAFMSAHELHSEVPLLRPKHHENLLRRISRLPPPPSPVGISIVHSGEREEAKSSSDRGKEANRGPIRPGTVVIRKR